MGAEIFSMRRADPDFMFQRHDSWIRRQFPTQADEHGTHIRAIRCRRVRTCRDYALSMIEALRRSGIAGAFFSGYLFIPRSGARLCRRRFHHSGVSGSTAECRLDRIDPTNACRTRDLVRVAVARDPRQAIPLHAPISARLMRLSAWMSHQLVSVSEKQASS